MKSPAFLNDFSHVCVVVIFFCALFVMSFILPRGIDITDEGLYLLAARYPHDLNVFATSAFYFTHLIFKAVGFSVPCFRFTSFILLLCTGIWCGLMASKIIILENNREDRGLVRISLACFSGIGAMVFYIWGGIFSPGYNALIASIINLSGGIGALYYYYSLTAENRKRVLLLSFSWGVLVGVAAFTKVTSAAVLIVLAMAWICVMANSTIAAIKRLICFFVGFILLIILFFLLIEKFSVWHQFAIINARQASIIVGLGTDFIFRTFQDISLSYHFVVVNFSMELILFFAFFCLHCLLASFKLLPKFLLLTLIIFLSLRLFIEEFFLGGFGHLFFAYCFYILCFLLLGIPFCVRLLFSKVADGDSERGRVFVMNQFRTRVFFYVFLLILPFAGAFGTTNQIMRNVLMNIAPWFALYLFIFFDLRNVWPRLFSSVFFILISFVAVFQVVSASVVEPYGMGANILKQTERTYIGVPESPLLLDKTTAKFINNLKAMAKEAGFKPGDSILAFTDMPGLVFVLGGRSPGVPWYAGKWGVLSNSRRYNEYVLSLVPDHVRRNSYLLLKMDDLTGFPELSKFGISFPDDYVYCGKLLWPATKGEVLLWRPKHISSKL